MSSALASASRLAPEIRLAQAVSEFKAALSDEQKATYRSYTSQLQASLIDAGDCMRLTAEIDRLTAGKVRGRRCFGTRFSNILQSLQQFAACGDVAIGCTQNPIACSIWSLLVANFFTYFDKLSTLLMVIGRSAPHYQSMALLYPHSKELQSYVSEYFIVIVRLFHSQFKLLQKSALGQFISISFPSEADLKTYQSDCELWAYSIKEEVGKLMATDVAQQGSRIMALLKSSESELLRKKHKRYLRILDSCSTFDYKKAWKDTRKIGYTTLLNQAPEYQHWKVQPDACTLVCTGRLGSGKSVLLANMVDDLNLHVQKEKLPVAYFFCQHDSPESLEARTVMGCLAQQLLCTTPVPSGLDDFADTTSPAMDLDRVLDLLLKVLPSRAYFIVDGLDECDDRQREILTSQLRRLQESSSLLVCLSFRSKASNASRLHLEQFAGPSTLQIPDDNPDIEDYITAELERRIESEKLKIGEPNLILEIRDALLQGAQGMFLWVALQIESLCAAKTDEAIRQALVDLPRDLPSTFSRILQKSEGLGKPYQEQTLRLIVAAYRPLTTDELREALSVVPGDTDWKPAQILNDVYSVLACCGSLVIVEEEDSAVRLVHHSVKQFLLGGFEGVLGGIFTLDSAMKTMGSTIVTYLNYGVFDNQLSTRVVPQLMTRSAPSKIIRSTLDASSVQKLALRLLKSPKQSNYNIGNVLVDENRLFKAHRTDQFNFLLYAKSYWFQHIKCISPEKQVIYRLLLKVLKGRIVDTNIRDDNGSTPLLWAIEEGREAVVQLLLEEDADIESKDRFGQTPLSCAAEKGHEAVVQLLLKKGADIESEDISGWTPLLWATKMGHEAVVQLLLKKGADTESKDSSGGMLLLWAAEKGHEAVVQLLLEKGADIESENRFGQTPLSQAIEKGHKVVVQLLLEKGADIESKNRFGQTPLSWAAEKGHEAVVQLLLEKGADIESKNMFGLTPLLWAAEKGHEAVVQLLLKKGADIESKDSSGWTPLSRAAGKGHEAVVQLLLEKGADIESSNSYGQTPLSRAAEKGHEAVVQLLKLSRMWQLARGPRIVGARQSAAFEAARAAYG